MGEEADPSTIGRAGVTLRPPMVVLRSIGGGIEMVGDDMFSILKIFWERAYSYNCLSYYVSM